MRETILAAAESAFARDGYGKASIRAIAKAAKVDAALVRHFFTPKEGLFAAVMDDAVQPVNLGGGGTGPRCGRRSPAPQLAGLPARRPRDGPLRGARHRATVRHYPAGLLPLRAPAPARWGRGRAFRGGRIRGRRRSPGRTSGRAARPRPCASAARAARTAAP
ncbi:helix-turn-helix domain-containing protein [Streptomyces johnsoniae]|uniref:Helix-turn-helix domain-containing protein n=1 Tax=Streptomyces johnsoniae TaxID=3075532 RepID=A0ABU2RXB8_9ACTN|nr:helix-turn-helix domain-containing protein [Streptomyces sp. DSM 41886]MDT0441401.1 helix-turn-helix domain-containing protein [Streptomyces sp. DSM 41886]